jgi:tRNA(His) 5'-end guanylyltransferase
MKTIETDSLGNRMKQYEEVNLHYLTRRMPLIIRVDGKAFHGFTKRSGFQKPFDEDFAMAMVDTGKGLLEEIQGSKLAYIQSDEISILATDYENIDTQTWFEKNLQKIVSISASIATICFNKCFIFLNLKAPEISDCGLFDSRAFVLPKEEVCNYFIWRQNDCTRNSIQGLGQANFSHKEMSGLNNEQVQEKLFKEKGINWNNIDIWKKRGICLYKEQVAKTVDGYDVVRTEIIEDRGIPIFTQDRNYIERWI